MFDKNRPMNLGDIISLSFDLLKLTITRSLILAAAIMIPAAILLLLGFNSLSSLASVPEPEIFGNILNMMLSLFFFLFSFVLFFILYLAMWTGVTFLASGELKGIRYSISEVFKKLVSVMMLKILALTLLLGLIIGSFFLISVIMFAAGSPFNYIGLFLFFPAMIFALIFFYKWYFAPVFIVDSGTGVFNSFSKSSFIVKGYWWRTFGILVLLGILIDFAVSVITTPITFLVMWDLISSVFTMETGASEAMDSSVAFAVLNKMSLVITLTLTLQLLIEPFYTIVMYYDLRIRKNDFDPEAEENTQQIEE